MPPVEFEPTISAGEQPQTYALDCAATVTGISDGILSTKGFLEKLANDGLPHQEIPCLVWYPKINKNQ
jgi:hypothetical protein